MPSKSLSNKYNNDTLHNEQYQGTFLLPRLLTRPIFHTKYHQDDTPIPGKVSRYYEYTSNDTIPKTFHPKTTTRLPFCSTM